VPNKKSGELAARQFQARATALEKHCDDVLASNLSDQDMTWAVEGALIKLAASFDRLMFDALVAAINNNTQHLSAITGTDFPKHLTDEVCEYIVTGGKYFDYRGRSGLIQTLKQFLPATHYLVSDVKKDKYRASIDRLIALRNFAAHESPQSKKAAKDAIATNIRSSGAWLKRQDRFRKLSTDLRNLAKEIENDAPF
jgi:hypothetical protein